jgi:hypothetical protein
MNFGLGRMPRRHENWMKFATLDASQINILSFHLSELKWWKKWDKINYHIKKRKSDYELAVR